MFEWERPHFQGRNAAASSESAEKDREPLGPDYKDPDPSATEDKPEVAGKINYNKLIIIIIDVLRNFSEKDKPVLNPKKENQGPKHPGTGVIAGGGVVDIDATSGGFPAFPSPFGPEFDFPALPGLDKPAGGFGFGGLFGIDDGKKWWKG